MWLEVQTSFFVARAARNGQLQFPVIQFSLRVFSSAAISASDSWRSSQPASLPRDQSVTAQPISIRKAQSRKKSPQTFAHLVNFPNSCVGHLNVSVISTSTCHRSTSYVWLCYLNRSEGLLMAYHLTLAPWIFQRLPVHRRTETTLQFVFWTLSFACLSRAFPSASSHWTIGGSSATAPCQWVRSVRHLSSVWDTSHSQHFLVCNSVVHT